MRLSISQAAQRSGVSVRTLRYYDEIGLLKPSEVTPAGYRYYDGPALETLQQIVFYRELGLPLEQISTILRAPDHNRTEALRRHRQLLLMKRRRLDDMLRLLDETIGGTAMYNEMPRPTQNEVDDLYHCSNAILRCLGDMYLSDPRMTENLDRYGPDTAQLIHDAILIFCGP